MLLKLLTYLTLRKYDHIYAPNLYSFRPGVCAKDAIMTICRTKDLHDLYSYKIDVSDYFNSIPVDKICSVLDETISKVILDKLAEKGLTVNPDKEFCGRPEDGFTFLGVEVKNGSIDIAPASVVKLKQKMRRKARALDRWRHREGIWTAQKPHLHLYASSITSFLKSMKIQTLPGACGSSLS